MQTNLRISLFQHWQYFFRVHETHIYGSFCKSDIQAFLRVDRHAENVATVFSRLGLTGGCQRQCTPLLPFSFLLWVFLAGSLCIHPVRWEPDSDPLAQRTK